MREKADGSSSTQMDVDKYQISGTSIVEAEKSEEHRPNFVNRAKLLALYICAICSDVLLKPHQTPCGCRVCEPCVSKLFGDRDHILPCPMPHDDLDEDDLEECQRIGLHKTSITPDHAVTNFLLKERCFCSNQSYGCDQRVPLRKLKEHEMTCDFRPRRCTNTGCTEVFAALQLSEHLERCQYVDTKCSFCHQTFLRKDIENHMGECDRAETQCQVCKRSFEKRKLLITHQSISASCLTKPGKCYYSSYCGFKSESVETLRQHLRDNVYEHTESLALSVHNATQDDASAQLNWKQQVKKTISDRVKPLEKVTAELTMKMIKYVTQMEASTTNGEALQDAMKVVNNTTQEVDNVKSRVSHIERQIKDSGLDRVTVIESHTQSIKRSNDQLTDIEKRVRNLETISDDGTITWKIQDYKRRRSDAVRGRQMSIYSQPFFTSRNGYRMCLRVYLNGDGLGRGKCLSVFFVLMRGEYDELLQFPFKQRVTFHLINTFNPEQNKTESFVPDPESSSFRRPQTEMNIASGCPQFAPHSLVESKGFLVDDCIYIRAVVEPGGDRIQ